MAESRSASFSSSQVNTTTGSESDRWLYVNGSVGLHRENAHAATSSTGSANGSYTSASGTFTEQGTASSGSLNRNDASLSNVYSTTTPSGAAAHSDMASMTTINSQSSAGPYTKVNGAITKQQSSYTAGARTITQGSNQDANNGPLNSSASQSVSTSNSASTLTSAFSSGNYSQTGGNTVDSGWQTQYSVANNSGLRSTNTSYNASSQGSLVKVKLTGSNKSEYFEIGTYTNTNGVNSTASFVSQKTQKDSTELDDTSWSVSADPGTDYSSTASATATTTTGKFGLQSVSAGQVTSASFNFKNTSTSHLQSSYGASQDVSVQGVPAAGAPTGTPLWGDWSNIPVLITPPDGALTRGTSLPAIDSPTIGTEADPQPVTYSSTAQATTTFDSKNTANGVTTSISGTTSTSFSYSNSQSTTNTALQTISASFSYSFSGAGSSQITDSKSNSASASETDTSNGTNNNGVVSGTSRNWGSELRSYSSSYVYDGSNTTSAGFTNSHSATIASNYELTSVSKTGGFKASSASSSPSYNETTTASDQATNALSVTQTYNGSGPTASASSSGTYFAGASGAVWSTLTLTVDPTHSVDTRSGTYGGAGTQTTNSSFTETGDATYVGVLKKHWEYQHTTNSQKSMADTAGTYSNPQQNGIKTTVFSGGGQETANYTITDWDDMLNGWGPSYSYKDGGNPTNFGPIITVGYDGMAGNPPGDDPNAASDPNAPWYNDSWADWLNPVAYVASAYYRIKDGIAGLHQFFTTDNKAYWATYGGRLDALNAELANPNSRMTIGEFQRARNSLMAGAAKNVIEDAARYVNGIMVVAELAGYAKLAVQAGMGLANLGYKAFNFVSNNGVPNTLRYVTNRTTCIIFNGGNCFAAGTPILTPGGAKTIESFQVGDTVYSRPDEDPHGAVRIGIVDAIFERSTHIWEVHVGGKVIETTGEHPFYIVERGWTTANRLEAGDRLVGHCERCAVVERVIRSTRTATVYNMRVESDHTYFVGGDAWGFSIWAHNANYLRNNFERAYVFSPGRGYQAAHIVPQGNMSGRSAAVQLAIKNAKRALASARIGINDGRNGFWTNSLRHMGTHTDKFYLELGRVMEAAEKSGTVPKALEELLAQIYRGFFL